MAYSAQLIQRTLEPEELAVYIDFQGPLEAADTLRFVRALEAYLRRSDQLGSSAMLELVEYRTGSGEWVLVTWLRDKVGNRGRKAAEILALQRRDTEAAEDANAVKREEIASRKEMHAQTIKAAYIVPLISAAIYGAPAVIDSIAKLAGQAGPQSCKIASDVEKEEIPLKEVLEKRAAQLESRKRYLAPPQIKDASVEPLANELPQISYREAFRELEDGIRSELPTTARINNDGTMLVTEFSNIIPIPEKDRFQYRPGVRYFVILKRNRDGSFRVNNAQPLVDI